MLFSIISVNYFNIGNEILTTEHLTNFKTNTFRTVKFQTAVNHPTNSIKIISFCTKPVFYSIFINSIVTKSTRHHIYVCLWKGSYELCHHAVKYVMQTRKHVTTRTGSYAHQHIREKCEHFRLFNINNVQVVRLEFVR